MVLLTNCVCSHHSSSRELGSIGKEGRGCVERCLVVLKAANEGIQCVCVGSGRTAAKGAQRLSRALLEAGCLLRQLRAGKETQVKKRVGKKDGFFFIVFVCVCSMGQVEKMLEAIQKCQAQK